ncbi:MAG: bifunctional glutamine-synthetase adenylyltransferase/deadenyltransferase, partial [Bifidobacterium sp.]|nr:bifunctional glutamine-synthetase adenylyltransferase/deadenyltransferase [Bifidobacterium sp.]
MTVPGTFDTSARELIHAGLQNLDEARSLFRQLSASGFDAARCGLLLDALQHVCDPDVALRNLVDIVNAQVSQGRALDDIMPDDTAFRQLVAVLGVSDAMGKLMRFRPDLVQAAATDHCNSHLYNHDQRRAHVLESVGADPNDRMSPTATMDLADAATALRRTYRNQLAAIIAQDTMSDDPIALQPRISSELSDLADAALEGALAIARHEITGSEHCRFAIIGMGKLGARELNYVSDVDLIYVVKAADADTSQQQLYRIGTKMGTMLQRVCQSVIMGVAEPALWQIDGGLRPEGKDGSLVRTLESHQAYYEKWAQNWEFQALLKARPVAGDPQIGDAYMSMTRPMVWSASKRKNFVYDCQQMRKRVEDLIAPALKDREIKLGRGGLRDVEFTVQMLQLVHGRTDETLRASATLESLRRLSEGGYVSRKQAAKLARDYSFERVMEHRQQMWALKRTHLFPDLGDGSVGGLEKKRDVN